MHIGTQGQSGFSVLEKESTILLRSLMILLLRVTMCSILTINLTILEGLS